MAVGMPLGLLGPDRCGICCVLVLCGLAIAGLPEAQSDTSYESTGEITIQKNHHLLKNQDDVLTKWVSGRAESCMDEFPRLVMDYPNPGFQGQLRAEYDLEFKVGCNFDHVITLEPGTGSGGRIPVGKYTITALAVSESSLNTRGIASIQFQVDAVRSNRPPPPSTDFDIELAPLVEDKIGTDFDLYELGETVEISGSFYVPTNLDRNILPAIVIQILGPTGNIVDVKQFVPNEDGLFNYSLKLAGSLFIAGGYEIIATFGNREATSNFGVVQTDREPIIHNMATIELSGFGNNFDFGRAQFQNQWNDARFEGGDGSTIHLYEDDISVQQFLDSLGIYIGPSSLSHSGNSFCEPPDTLEFFVNNRDINRLSDYIIRDNDHIAINCAKFTPPPPVVPPTPVSPPTPVTPPAPTPTPVPVPPPTVVNPTTQPSSGQLDLVWVGIILGITGGGIGAVMAVKYLKSKPKQPLAPGQRSRAGPMTTTPGSQRRPKVNAPRTGILFYECPQCHDPDISNNPDGSATCDACGFRN
ncbi:MAG: hypothetical protein MPL62_02440 [Alphaproteobacteria bacterium]|nr:hypothetical protein [Alphaproteobacteria bacterium]